MKKLFLTLLCAFPLVSMERLRPENIQAPSRLGDIDLRHDDHGLYLMRDGKAQPIERHQCDATLRKLIAAKKLKEFQNENGYIQVNEMDNEELALRANVRVLGGGPMLSAFSYLAVKTIGYTVMMTTAAVVGTASVAAGPGGPAVTGMAMGIAATSGGTAAYLVSLEALAVKAACVTAVLPTW